MKIEEFLALAAPDRYDFSNDGASEEYLALDNFKNDLEKFIIYMSKVRGYKRTKEDIMKYGADFSQKYKDVEKLARKMESFLWMSCFLLSRQQVFLECRELRAHSH